MSKVKILVVEDKAIVAKDISATLEDLNYDVVAISDNGKDAIAQVFELKPDLILLDINLKGDMDGIEVASKINGKYPLPVVYLTAYADKATLERAKDTHPYAYIVKPFDERDLQIAIDLAIHNFASHNGKENSNSRELDNYVIRNNFFIKQNSRYHKLSIEDILYVEASGSYIDICLTDRKLTLAVNLLHFENQIDHANFIRIHRSYIINLSKIDSFEYGRLFIGDREIPISRQYREEFLRQVQQL